MPTQTPAQIVRNMSHRDLNIQRKAIADAINDVSSALFEGATGTITDGDYKNAYENLSALKTKIQSLLIGITQNPVYIVDRNYTPRNQAHKVEEGYKLHEATRPLTAEELADNYEREYIVCAKCGAVIKNTPSAIKQHEARPICIKNRHKFNAVKKEVKNNNNALINFDRTSKSQYLLSKYFKGTNMCSEGGRASNYMAKSYEEFCVNIIKSRYKGYKTRKYEKGIWDKVAFGTHSAHDLYFINQEYGRIKEYLAGTRMCSPQSLISLHIYE